MVPWADHSKIVCFRDNAMISLPVNPDISVVRVIFVIYVMCVRDGPLFPIKKNPPCVMGRYYKPVRPCPNFEIVRVQGRRVSQKTA
jgi:hypothetical protein